METEQPGEQCPSGTEELCSGPSFKPVGKQSWKEQLQLSGDSPAHHLIYNKSFRTHACHCHRCQTCLLLSSSPEALQDLTLEFPRQGSSHVLLQGMLKVLEPWQDQAFVLVSHTKAQTGSMDPVFSAKRLGPLDVVKLFGVDFIQNTVSATTFF